MCLGVRLDLASQQFASAPIFRGGHAVQVSTLHQLLHRRSLHAEQSSGLIIGDQRGPSPEPYLSDHTSPSGLLVILPFRRFAALCASHGGTFAYFSIRSLTSDRQYHRI